MARVTEADHTEEADADGGNLVRTIGLGLITGAADDDPSAIGTYASAGALIGPSFLWTAPVTLPMMVTVVYLASKLGQVSGMGLLDCIKANYRAWVKWTVVTGLVFGNTVEAGADLGGMGASTQTLLHVPLPVIVVPMAVGILLLQIFASYERIRSVFRWLVVALFAYIPAAILAKPDFVQVLKGTFIPTIRFDHQFLALLVAVVGTRLSAYLFSWQSNQEVEEEVALGRESVDERQGATATELRRSRGDIGVGMLFSNLVMYFIILATASTLHQHGATHISSTAQAANALRPIAGDVAGLLFAVGVVGVGFLAVPVMTTGAAYDVCQAVGWRNGLHARPREARAFYVLISVFSFLGIMMNLFGINPIDALVFAGVVQGFSTPMLLFLIMRLTNNAELMGDQRNSLRLNICGWVTTVMAIAAAVGLIAVSV